MIASGLDDCFGEVNMAPGIDNVVLCSYKDQLLRKLPRLLVLGMNIQPQAKKKRCHADRNRTKKTWNEAFRHVKNLYERACGLFLPADHRFCGVRSGEARQAKSCGRSYKRHM